MDVHDDEILRHHIAISKDLPSYLSLPAQTKEFASGRPLPELLMWLTYKVGGNSMAAFHLLPIASHTIAAILLVLVGCRLGMPLTLSMAGSLLFIVNLAHFHALHWVAGLAYPLALIGCLAATLCFFKHLQQPNSRWIWGFHLCLLIGLTAHSASAAVWLFCLLCAWRKNANLKRLLPHLLASGVMATLTALWLLSTTSEKTSTWDSLNQAGPNPFSLIADAVPNLLWFLGRLGSTAHWLPHSIHQHHAWEPYLGALILAGLLLLIWRQRTSGAWALWVLATLAPFTPLSDHAVGGMPAGPSRYLYLASAGTSMLLAWGVYRIACLADKRLTTATIQRLSTLAIAAILVSGVLNLQRIKAFSRYTSGRYYISQGHIHEGMRQLQQAINEDKGSIPLEDAYFRLISQRISEGLEVSPLLANARSRLPHSTDMRLIAAVVEATSTDEQRQQQGRSQLEELRAWAQRNRHMSYYTTNVAALYFNTALGFGRTEQFERAVEPFRQVLRLVPNHAEARAKSPYALAMAGQYQEAGEHWLQLGQKDQALAAFQKAIEQAPNNPAAQVRYGWALLYSGHLDQAIDQFRQLLDAGPNSAAQFHLGLAYLMQGKVKQALAAYELAVERYGIAAGKKVGAKAQLEGLLKQGMQVKIVKAILAKHWKED